MKTKSKSIKCQMLLYIWGRVWDHCPGLSHTSAVRQMASDLIVENFSIQGKPTKEATGLMDSVTDA